MPLLADLAAINTLQAVIHEHLTALLSEPEDQDELGLSQYLQLVNHLYFSTLKILLDFTEFDSDDAKEAREMLMTDATEALELSQNARCAVTIHENIPGRARRNLLERSRLLRSYYSHPQMESLLVAIDSDMAWRSRINLEGEGSMDEETGDGN